MSFINDHQRRVDCLLLLEAIFLQLKRRCTRNLKLEGRKERKKNNLIAVVGGGHSKEVQKFRTQRNQVQNGETECKSLLEERRRRKPIRSKRGS